MRIPRPDGAGRAALAGLAAAVLIVFGRSVGFGYTGWDDIVFHARNPLLDGSGLDLLRPGSIPGEKLYVPLTYLSWLVEGRILGRGPAVAHLLNVALHLANTFLVWGLARRLGAARLPAFLGTLLFAVHPLQAESVAWIMGRKELLSACLGLLAIHGWMRHRDGGGGRPLAGAALAFALGLLAKPSLAVLPAVLLLLPARGGGPRVPWRSLVPFAAAALAAVVLAGAVPSEPADGGPPMGFRLLCVPWLLWHGAGRLLLLTRPSPFVPWPSVEEAGAIALRGLPLLVAGAAALGVAIRRRRPERRGLLALAVLLLPSAAIVVGRREFVTADRYAYPILAVLGVLLALLPHRGRATRGLLAAFVVAAGVLAFPAVSVWRDRLSVWDRMLESTPDFLFARVNRANSLAELGRTDEAVAEFERALRLDPEGLPILRNEAICLLRAGRFEAAIPVLAKARSLAPRDPGFAVLLGDALLGAGRPADAVRHYRDALSLAPGDRYAEDRLREALR